MEVDKFTGEIVIQPKEEAIKEAKKYRTGLVMWIDRSKLDHGGVGTAVCWKEKVRDLWKKKSVFLGKNKEVLDAELWAISDALDIAAKETLNTPVTIFCDSQEAFRIIKRPLCGYYISWRKEDINPTLANAPKKYASRYYQLKVGHGAIGTFLTRIGVIESPECWWCGAAEQSVEHLYTECRRWRKEKRKLVRELEKEGIEWQAQAERRWLADLLANEKAVAPLLRFLKATDIGGREGARERELEWEQKNNRAGEDLLG